MDVKAPEFVETNNDLADYFNANAERARREYELDIRAAVRGIEDTQELGEEVRNRERTEENRRAIFALVAPLFDRSKNGNIDAMTMASGLLSLSAGALRTFNTLGSASKKVVWLGQAMDRDDFVF